MRHTALFIAWRVPPAVRSAMYRCSDRGLVSWQYLRRAGGVNGSFIMFRMGW